MVVWFWATTINAEFPVGTYFYPFTTKDEEVVARAARAGFPPVDETELVKHASPMFHGHEQPKTYCLGDPTITNWDNTDPEAMDTQIGLMQDVGLEFVVFDTYGGIRDGRKVREYDGPLATFLKAETGDLKFAIMWSVDAPRVILPVPGNADLKKEPGRAYDVTPETARFIVDECITKYWNQPSYLHINGRPHLSLYNTVMPINDETKGPFLRFSNEIKDYARRQYKVEPYLVAIGRGSRKANDAMDAASAYALLPDFFCDSEYYIQDYDDLVAGLPKRWRDISGSIHVPFVPPAVLAWDASPRGAPGQRLEDVAGRYPFTPVVVGSTPEKAAALLQATLDWVSNDVRIPLSERYGIICAWNEISEGATLLPEVKDGVADFSYFTAIAKVLRNRSKGKTATQLV